jgi:hypothetical protein
LQTLFLWQHLVGVIFFAVLLRSGPPAGAADVVGGAISAGTLGMAPGLLMLLVADGSTRRVRWGWPPWDPEPWRGAAWQMGKAVVVLAALGAGGWLITAGL